MVWSAHRLDNTCLDDLEAVRVKGLKRRGLSRFYSDRSQSFSSMELVLCTALGESSLALAKRSSSNASSEDCSMGRLSPTSPGQATSRSSGQSCAIQSHGDGGQFDVSTDAIWPHQAEDICAALRLTSLGQAVKLGDVSSGPSRDALSRQRACYRRSHQHTFIIGTGSSSL